MTRGEALVTAVLVGGAFVGRDACLIQISQDRMACSGKILEATSREAFAPA